MKIEKLKEENNPARLSTLYSLLANLLFSLYCVCSCIFYFAVPPLWITRPAQVCLMLNANGKTELALQFDLNIL